MRYSEVKELLEAITTKVPEVVGEPETIPNGGVYARTDFRKKKDTSGIILPDLLQKAIDEVVDDSKLKSKEKVNIIIAIYELYLFGIVNEYDSEAFPMYDSNRKILDNMQKYVPNEFAEFISEKLKPLI